MFDAEESEDSAKNSDGHLKSEDERSDEAEFEYGAKNSDGHLESKDEGSDEAEFEYGNGSDREENAGSGDDVDALNGKKEWTLRGGC